VTIIIFFVMSIEDKKCAGSNGRRKYAESLYS
jgi:hypothetical protein